MIIQAQPEGDGNESFVRLVLRRTQRGDLRGRQGQRAVVTHAGISNSERRSKSPPMGMDF
jgi:hypothetical protein